MNQKTKRRQQTKAEASTYALRTNEFIYRSCKPKSRCKNTNTRGMRWVICRMRNRTIDNAKQIAGARIRTRKEWGELSGECSCRGRHNVTLSLYWNHEPDDDETSTNEESSKYLRTANQGIDPSIMQNKETVQEKEHERNEVSYP